MYLPSLNSPVLYRWQLLPLLESISPLPLGSLERCPLPLQPLILPYSFILRIPLPYTQVVDLLLPSQVFIRLATASLPFIPPPDFVASVLDILGCQGVLVSLGLVSYSLLDIEAKGGEFGFPLKNTRQNAPIGPQDIPKGLRLDLLYSGELCLCVPLYPLRDYLQLAPVRKYWPDNCCIYISYFLEGRALGRLIQSLDRLDLPSPFLSCSLDIRSLGKLSVNLDPQESQVGYWAFYEALNIDYCFKVIS